jgi:hypothetical protein
VGAACPGFDRGLTEVWPAFCREQVCAGAARLNTPVPAPCATLQAGAPRAAVARAERDVCAAAAALPRERLGGDAALAARVRWAARGALAGNAPRRTSPREHRNPGIAAMPSTSRGTRPPAPRAAAAPRLSVRRCGFVEDRARPRPDSSRPPRTPRAGELRTFRPGQCILPPGHSAAPGIYVVISGLVRVVVERGAATEAHYVVRWGGAGGAFYGLSVDFLAARGRASVCGCAAAWYVAAPHLGMCLRRGLVCGCAAAWYVAAPRRTCCLLQRGQRRLRRAGIP